MKEASCPPPVSGPTLAALDRVSKRFGDNVVLDNLSLALVEGGVTCLLGPSGCGKSTLLRIAAGLLPADAGRTLLDHAQCGVVFQDPRLLPWLTVAENLGLAKRGGTRGDRAAAIARVLAMVELSDEVAGLLPRELSGGMAQRVGLARALLRRPRFLLMDEPFAALDAFTRGVLQKMMASLVAGRDVTCLFVTHDIDEALLLGDYLYVMGEGAIALGSPVGDVRDGVLKQKILDSLRKNDTEDIP